jgi:hypothetical protein
MGTDATWQEFNGVSAGSMGICVGRNKVFEKERLDEKKHFNHSFFLGARNRSVDHSGA